MEAHSHEPREEWNLDDEDVFLGVCDGCDETRPVRVSDDPYIAEVYPEDAPRRRAYCLQCYLARKDQV
jgi:hypothetical protein